MPRRPVEPAKASEPDPMAEHDRGQRLRNDVTEQEARERRIKNDAAQLAHKRESSAAGSKHFNDRRLAETKRVKAHSELEQHKTSHAKELAKHDVSDRKIKTASAQADLDHKRAMHAHQQAQAAKSADREDERHARWRVENEQHDEDRAHRYLHAAQLHHHLLREERRRAWTAIAAGITGEHGGLKSAVHKQMGGGH